MHELNLSHRVQNQLREADHLHTHGFKVEVRRNRVLHPAVSDKNPQRRQVGAERYQPCHGHVLHFAQTIPTEEEQTYKGRFEKEGH